jgi:hypothetical protein
MFDDGGLSGGKMERPALQRLLMTSGITMQKVNGRQILAEKPSHQLLDLAA